MCKINAFFDSLASPSGVVFKWGITLKTALTGQSKACPLSPLLSKVVLDELDKELEKRGLAFVRFADDSNLFVRSEKAAQRVMNSITKFIENRLKLKVNQDKSKVALSKAVRFLGMTIIAGSVAISSKSMKKAMEKAMEKVAELTPSNSPIPVHQTLERVNTWYRGWAQYHSMTQYPSQLLQIEAHVRRRLRARIVRQCKKRRTLHKRLLSRGITKKTAAKAAFGPHGRWKLSHGALQHAYTVHWFIEKAGQYIHSNKHIPTWFPQKKWIKLR